jgi:hypothetical protein
MKGHIRERSPGHWAIILDVRDPETGQRKRKWHSFLGTKLEAQTECSRLVTEFYARVVHRAFQDDPRNISRQVARAVRAECRPPHS